MTVSAIAITLLILDLSGERVSGPLPAQLLHLVPSFLGLLVSFALIGVMWLNHHQMFRDIRAADHGLFLLKLALLFGVTFVPYPTNVIGQQLAGGNFAEPSHCRHSLRLYLRRHRDHLQRTLALGRPGPPADRAEHPSSARPLPVLAATCSVAPCYAAALLVAFFRPEWGFAIVGAIALLFLVTTGPLDRLLVPELRHLLEAERGTPDS